MWVHDINLEREDKGEFSTLFHNLREDERRFYKYFRMTISSFDELLTIIKAYITKENTNYRFPISPEERLAITLR